MTIRPAVCLATFASVMVLVAACGRTPLAGLEGEFCAADSDCIEGLLCDRNICLSEDRAGPRVQREGIFFAGLRFTDYLGNGEAQLVQFAQFVSDLSDARFPYFAVHAPSESQLDFGLANVETNPVTLDTETTVTSLGLGRNFTNYVTETDTIAVPIVYADDAVDLDFDLILINARIELDFENALGPTGQLVGDLRAVDTENMDITADGDTFTLFDVLRDEVLTVDTDRDGVEDAWRMRWVLEPIMM